MSPQTREGDAAPLVEGEQDGEEEEGRILDRESLLQLFLSISPVKGVVCVCVCNASMLDLCVVRREWVDYSWNGKPTH